MGSVRGGVLEEQKEMQIKAREWLPILSLAELSIVYLRETEGLQLLRLEDVPSLREGRVAYYSRGAYAKLAGFMEGLLENPELRDEDGLVYIRRGQLITERTGFASVTLDKVVYFLRSLVLD